MVELSVIIPAFNEAHVIENNVRQVIAALDKLKITYEIICVNDGSTDTTLASLERLRDSRINLLSYPENQGKGYAVRFGMNKALGKYRLFMDADLATSLDAIGIFYDQMCRGTYDLILGDRQSDSTQQRQHQPLYRRILGRIFTLLSCLCVGRNINDFTCGFKIFSSPASTLIFNQQRINNWAFDTELIYIAVLNKLRIGQIPVAWKHQPHSKVRAMRDIVTSLRDLLRIRINGMTCCYTKK